MGLDGPEPKRQDEEGDVPADSERNLEGEDDDVFDYGKAKMEFFKQRARQILMDMPPGAELEDEYSY